MVAPHTNEDFLVKFICKIHTLLVCVLRLHKVFYGAF